MRITHTRPLRRGLTALLVALAALAPAATAAQAADDGAGTRTDPRTPSGAFAAPRPGPTPDGRYATPQLPPEVARVLDRLLRGGGRLDETGAAVAPDALDLTAPPVAGHAGPTPRGGGFADPSTREVFDIDLFERNIRAALAGETVGYAYSIGTAGTLHSQDGVGEARTDADAPQLDQSATKPMTVASISKTVTAVLALRLLAAEGISVDDSIEPWLPSTWDRGDGVADISFRDLMTHKSGLRQSYEAATGKGGAVTGAYDNIRIAVAQDVGSTGYLYANMNFSIFRILLPQILGFDSAPYEGNPYLPANFHEILTAAVFHVYATEVLGSIGIDGSCEPTDPDPTVLYRFPYTGVVGWTTPSYVLGCGGYGFYLSANQLAAFLSYLRYTDDLLSPATRDLMYDGRLGLKAYGGQHGTYLGHGGQWKTGAGGMDGCVMSFSIHVDAALLINSRVGDYDLPCTLLKKAFDDAWVPN